MVSTKQLGGGWLRAAEIKTATVAQIMDEADVGEVDGNKQYQCVLQIGDQSRNFGINKTNLTILEDAFGEDTKSWIGRKIILHPHQATLMGKVVPSIRVGVPSDLKQQPAATEERIADEPESQAAPAPQEPEKGTCQHERKTTIGNGIQVCFDCGERLKTQ